MWPIIKTVYAADPTPCVDADSITKGFGPCPAGLDQFQNTLANVISIMVGLGFIAMLILILWAGIKYLTSGGEPKAVQAAHQTLTWALLGILFFGLAWVILLLIEAFTGINVTVFNIKALCDIGGKEFCKP